MSDEYISRLIGSAPSDFVERPLFGARLEIDDSVSAAAVRPAEGRGWLSADDQRRVPELALEISRLKTARALKLRLKSAYTNSRSCSLATISRCLEEIQEIEMQIGRLETRLQIICG